MDSDAYQGDDACKVDPDFLRIFHVA
jgi:hypothetical protein